MNLKYIRFFDEIGNDDVALVGGKNASLGEMYRHLSPKGVKIPFGFATTSEAYNFFLSSSGLHETIDAILENLNTEDLIQLSAAGAKLRHTILNADLPGELIEEIRHAYTQLCHFYNNEKLDVAVRSSATAEDLPNASFAGQQESYLNICGEAILIEHVKRCYASLFTDRAISYRHAHGFDHAQVSLCVGVQKMVRSDKSASGVLFSIDPDSGSQELIVLNSIWGLGENIVGGKVNPDEFKIFKPTLKQGYSTILKRRLGSKELTMIYDPNTPSKTLNTRTPSKRQKTFSLSDEDVMTLSRNALAIEEHYSSRAGEYRPMDIEWAKDGNDGELYIVQARPETVQSKKIHEHSLSHQTYRMDPNQDEKVLVTGTAVGEKIASGKVKIINNCDEFSLFEKGDVLVTDITDPDWEPIMEIASAIITNRGGRTCHAAIIAREIGVPALVGTGDATDILSDGMSVTLSCAEGDIGFVYEGTMAFSIDEFTLENLSQPKTHLYLNVGDPDKAFGFAALPNNGVGLARMEFIINNAIKAHPMALVELHAQKSIDDEEAIRALIGQDTDPQSFFINRLSEGIATIAAAFYPKPVIVRTSDLKSNEYKNMLGGSRYEPDEENPMIGYRGASRYYSENYRQAFEWECLALKRVRDTMGLTNVRIMLPFVRTPQEGSNVIKIMSENGLKQGENSLEIYAMCEIPSNVILADRFLEIFDGYSIGSNDLTQLTLGVDRDSDIVAHVFDERDEAVKRMLKMAIQACKKAGKYIGICGQAPSDYPEITEFLVAEGIDSISLNPDSIIKTWQLVTDVENRMYKG